MDKLNCPLLPFDIFCRKKVDDDSQVYNKIVDGRPISYTLRVIDRKKSVFFFRKILGMQVLRHEEFASGCGPACKGLCGTMWSRTMVGYGPEENHFAFELLYSYNKEKYQAGNALCSVTIKGSECLKQAVKNNWPVGEGHVLISPTGYKFIILKQQSPRLSDPIQKITLYSSNLKTTVNYWNRRLGMNITYLSHRKRRCEFSYKENTCTLEYQEIDTEIIHGESYGRLCLTCPGNTLPKIERNIIFTKYKIMSPLTTVKASMHESYRVIVLKDPDNHEICFYDEISYKKICKYNPEAKDVLDRYIKLEYGASNNFDEPEEPAKRNIETKTDPQQSAVSQVQATPAGSVGSILLSTGPMISQESKVKSPSNVPLYDPSVKPSAKSINSHQTSRQASSVFSKSVSQTVQNPEQTASYWNTGEEVSSADAEKIALENFEKEADPDDNVPEETSKKPSEATITPEKEEEAKDVGKTENV